MCGIAGIVGAFDPAGEDIRSMLNVLTHRGPDGGIGNRQRRHARP